MNELLLILTLIIEFGAVLFAYRLFGKGGLYAMTAFCTITANIEVMILIHAFGMEQTLGNILFAASFAITDILSENESKKDANRAVNLGIFISVFFIIVSQSWFLYTPSPADTASPAIRQVFASTPRLMLVSIAVYAVTQKLDVWMYHKWWSFTTKKFGDSRRFLWLRNNAATLTAQLINSFLFNFGAFYGTYPIPVLIGISLSSYVIYIVTSLCDTPVVYIARRIKEKYNP
ncbi:MAG: VUT family protein [Ruminococcaceae bacterium]|nr:VUT family protein [Oscillospiraceae bacterium]